MWPVILRELRVGSRRWTTYWLRLLAAGLVMLAVLFWLGGHGHSRQAGSLVFAWVHRIVLASIWIIVPLMTCDCLSSEKREGTLGLLFLTDLSARAIVMAKAVAHGLRAFTLWLATVPLMAVPVLLGGLAWHEIVLSCALTFGSILFALSIGLWASATTRQINSSVALAALLAPAAGLAFVALLMALGDTLNMLIGAGQIAGLDWENSFGDFFGLLWNFDNDWSAVLSGSGQVLIIAALAFLPVAALILTASVIMVAGMLRRNWQDRPKTKRQSEVEKFFCAPSFFPKFFKGWMRRSLERNPIGWLEKRSWTGRITAWIWFALMISFGSMLAYSVTYRDLLGLFDGLMWMLLISIAYVAAGSFRRERETGALELILVTPLSERQVIHGRLRGLWGQFLPTFLLWVVMVLYLSSALGRWEIGDVLSFGVLFLVVPVVGLYFSLRSRFVLLAWVFTLTVCFMLPQLLGKACRLAILVLFSFSMDSSMVPREGIITLPVQLGIAALLLWRLRVNLVRRSFSLR